MKKVILIHRANINDYETEVLEALKSVAQSLESTIDDYVNDEILITIEAIGESNK